MNASRTARLLCALVFFPLFALASPTTPESAPMPPEWLARDVGKPLRLQGEGTLRWFGLRIYSASLWVTGEKFSYDAPFALDIVYQQAVDREGLVLATVPELGRISPQASARLDAWTADLRRVYPDIKEGDRLVAVWRPTLETTRFFLNGNPTGDVAGADFGRAFFAIWLDPATRRPELRRALLNEPVQRSQPATRTR